MVRKTISLWPGWRIMGGSHVSIFFLAAVQASASGLRKLCPLRVKPLAASRTLELMRDGHHDNHKDHPEEWEK